jgi:hypothetical protein
MLNTGVTTVVYPEALHGGARVTCGPLPSLLRTAFIVRKQGAQLAFNTLQSIRRVGKHRFHFPIREYGLCYALLRMRPLSISCACCIGVFDR